MSTVIGTAPSPARGTAKGRRVGSSEVSAAVFQQPPTHPAALTKRSKATAKAAAVAGSVASPNSPSASSAPTSSSLQTASALHAPPHHTPQHGHQTQTSRGRGNAGLMQLPPPGRPPWQPPQRAPYDFTHAGAAAELQDVLAYVRPTFDEAAARAAVVREIDDCVRSLWPARAARTGESSMQPKSPTRESAPIESEAAAATPSCPCDEERRGAYAFLYGSSSFGLALPCSDVDIAIMDLHEACPESALRALAELVQARLPHMLVQGLQGVRVPVLRLYDASRGLQLDVSVMTPFAEESVASQRRFMRAEPRAAALILVTKLILKQWGLNNVFTGGLSSSSLYLLVERFFRLRGPPPLTLAPPSPAGARDAQQSPRAAPAACVGGADVDASATGSLVSAGGSAASTRSIAPTSVSMGRIVVLHRGGLSSASTSPASRVCSLPCSPTSGAPGGKATPCDVFPSTAGSETFASDTSAMAVPLHPGIEGSDIDSLRRSSHRASPEPTPSLSDAANGLAGWVPQSPAETCFTPPAPAALPTRSAHDDVPGLLLEFWAHCAAPEYRDGFALMDRHDPHNEVSRGTFRVMEAQALLVRAGTMLRALQASPPPPECRGRMGVPASQWSALLADPRGAPPECAAWGAMPTHFTHAIPAWAAPPPTPPPASTYQQAWAQ